MCTWEKSGKMEKSGNIALYNDFTKITDFTCKKIL